MDERVQRFARKDHEQNCRNEPEWPYLSISHRHVHETNALRLARLSLPSDERVPDPPQEQEAGW